MYLIGSHLGAPSTHSNLRRHLFIVFVRLFTCTSSACFFRTPPRLPFLPILRQLTLSVSSLGSLPPPPGSVLMKIRCSNYFSSQLASLPLSRAIEKAWPACTCALLSLSPSLPAGLLRCWLVGFLSIGLPEQLGRKGGGESGEKFPRFKVMSKSAGYTYMEVVRFHATGELL